MILATARDLREKKVTSAELVARSLDLIEDINPKLNAFMTVMADAARTRAWQLDAELAEGIDRGPLHGIPVAVKDLFYTHGVRTTGGSKVFENFVPDYDAHVVTKLEEAGAVIVGKTGLHECAYGVTSNNAHFGAIHNPHNIECVPGGSSGGSGAAVAAGIVAMAMGTDTGGSIRIPASFCGCAGLKPTYGRVSKRGVLPLGFSLDHMGPLAHSVRDCAITFNAIAGHDPLDVTTSRVPFTAYLPPPEVSIADLRIGRPENYFFERVDPQVAEAVNGALRKAESLGAHIVPIRVPDIDALNAVARVMLLSEASAVYEAQWSKRELFSAEVLTLIDQGRVLPATDYVQAQRLRLIFLREFEKLWSAVDCWITPATPTAAPKIGQRTIEIDGAEEDVRLATTRFMRGINVLGYPALSVPCGRNSAGLPLGLQIVGPAFSEDLLLRAGAAIEK
jgi:aspartyl-tRNA(Asn)/glutamyl-tRNA(Gln) amidotransferase subunit A